MKKLDTYWVIALVAVASFCIFIIILIISYFNIPVDTDGDTPVVSTWSICSSGSWLMQSITPVWTGSSDNLFDNWILSIKNASTPEQANEAFSDWLTETRKHSNLLLAAHQTFAPEKAWFLDEKLMPQPWDCANFRAIEMVRNIEEAALKNGVIDVSVSYAPTDWYNTSIKNGKVVTADIPVIDGDRKALKVKLNNWRSVWIMWRCGNIVTPSKAKTTISAPKPAPPAPKLAPKSPNVEDYQRPGRDNTRDAGVGIKPKATVKAPAEKNPPKVIKKTAKAVRWWEIIIDNITDKPGSETNIQAAGAEPATKKEQLVDKLPPNPMGNTGTPVIPDKIKGQVLDKLENPSDSSIKIDKLPASAYDNADEVPPTINWIVSDTDGSTAQPAEPAVQSSNGTTESDSVISWMVTD